MCGATWLTWPVPIADAAGMPEPPWVPVTRDDSASPPPDSSHCVDLDEVGAGISMHLHRAMDAGVNLVVTIGGEPQITLETVEDLEVLHETLRARRAEPPEPPSTTGPAQRPT